jgi:putative ABC transport system permease protein
MDMALNFNGSSNEGGNIHFSVVQNRNSPDNKDENISNNIIENINGLDTISKVYNVYGTFGFKEYMDSSKEIDQVKSYANFYNKEQLNGDENTKKQYSGPITNMKVGDEIELKHIDGENKDNPIKKVKVMAILKDDPFGFDYAINGMKLITTEKVAKNLMGLGDIEPVALNIQIKDVKQEEKAQTQIEAAIQDNPSLGIINNIDINRQEKSGMLMVEILVYGFVIVISLIGSVNIINTLTTNIILRKREFAALKAIGLTQKGLKKMIVLEGLLYGIVGTIYGSIVACGLSYLLYISMRGIQDFPWSIPWVGIAIAGVASLLIGYLSVLSPLARINKENIIEVIREDA